VGSDDDAPFAAHRLLPQITKMRVQIDLAHFAPSESLEYQGHKVKCTVVQFEFKRAVDRDPKRPIEWHNTVWINLANLAVLKIEYRDHYPMKQGMVTPPNGEWQDRLDQTVFTVADLDPSIPHGTFSFAPAVGAKEVAKLPPLFPQPGTPVDGPSPEAAQYVGKRLPDIVVHDAAGADISLAQYEGHPLLIDVWATWCGPCIHDMPALGKLRASTSATDLQFVGIDEDGNTTDAVAYLKKNKYDWPDYHLTETAESALSVVGIPVTILVDAKGNVVYYHTGEIITKELVTAIRDLGSAYSTASTD